MQREKKFAKRFAEVIAEGEALIALLEATTKEELKEQEVEGVAGSAPHIRAALDDIRSVVRDQLAREFRNEFFPNKDPR